MTTDLSGPGNSTQPCPRELRHQGACCLPQGLLWWQQDGQELLPTWEALCGHSTRVPRKRQCGVVFVFNAWTLLALLLF